MGRCNDDPDTFSLDRFATRAGAPGAAVSQVSMATIDTTVSARSSGADQPNDWLRAGAEAAHLAIREPFEICGSQAE